MRSTAYEPNEVEFQSAVVDYARIKGWRCAHFRPARIMRNGQISWRTPVSADGQGFVDLVLARNGKILFWECKSNNGKVSAEQQLWLDALPGARVIRPRDWPEIERALE